MPRVGRLLSLEFGYEALPVVVEVGSWKRMGCTAEGIQKDEGLLLSLSLLLWLSLNLISLLLLKYCLGMTTVVYPSSLS